VEILSEREENLCGGFVHCCMCVVCVLCVCVFKLNFIILRGKKKKSQSNIIIIMIITYVLNETKNRY